MLIKRVYEVDPLACPKCSGQMKVVAFIESRQADVIEKIMRHCGLWQPQTPRPPPRDGPDFCGDGAESPAAAPRERTYVDMETFWATF
jgi:hypothetical protein